MGEEDPRDERREGNKRSPVACQGRGEAFEKKKRETKEDDGGGGRKIVVSHKSPNTSLATVNTSIDNEGQWTIIA